MTSKVAWQAPFAVGQTWTAQDGSVRVIVTLFADDGVHPASVRYSDGITGRTRTVSLVTMRGWLFSKSAVLA